jgi:hypothetical protein
MAKFSTTWNQHVNELISYVRCRPEIILNSKVLQIPENNRDEFYKIFDQARQSFLEYYFSTQLSEVDLLIRHFKNLKYKIKNELNLESITLPLALNRFILSPISFLTGQIREYQFALLKGDMNIEDFTSRCKLLVSKVLDDYYWQAFQYYSVLALLRELKPREIISVKAPEAGLHIKTQEVAGVFDKTPYMPTLQKASKIINFDSSSETMFITPNLIFYSSKLKTYASIRCGLREARWERSGTNNEKKYHKINKLNKVYGRGWFKLPFTVIHTDSSPMSLALVADREIIYQPQLVLFHQWSSKFSNFDRMREKIILCNNALRSTHGALFIHKNSDIFQHTKCEKLSSVKFEHDALSLNPILSSFGLLRKKEEAQS